MPKLAIFLLFVGFLVLAGNDRSYSNTLIATSPPAPQNNFDRLKAIAGSRRTAQSNCIEHGQVCVLGGTRCCDSTDTCNGKFPYTYCQAP